jgi:hypothetical protein
MRLAAALHGLCSRGRSVTTTERSKLKTLFLAMPSVAPRTSYQLAELGISAGLAVYYFRAGWHQRLVV